MNVLFSINNNNNNDNDVVVAAAAVTEALAVLAVVVVVVVIMMMMVWYTSFKENDRKTYSIHSHSGGILSIRGANPSNKRFECNLINNTTHKHIEIYSQIYIPKMISWMKIYPTDASVSVWMDIEWNIHTLYKCCNSENVCMYVCDACLDQDCSWSLSLSLAGARFMLMLLLLQFIGSLFFIRVCFYSI